MNKKGHFSLDLPWWCIPIFWGFLKVVDFIEFIENYTGERPAIIITICLAVIQVLLVVRYGWKTLIPFAIYILWSCLR